MANMALTGSIPARLPANRLQKNGCVQSRPVDRACFMRVDRQARLTRIKANTVADLTATDDHAEPARLSLYRSAEQGSLPDNAFSFGRRGLLSGAALAVGSTVFPLPETVLAADALPLVPQGVLFPGCKMKTVPSSIIKGCWQLSGSHKGDKKTDRTSGNAAIQDFQAFVDAGIDTFDTGPEACGYGPSEKIIGDYIRSRNMDGKVKVNTKFCAVGSEQYNMTRDFVTRNIDRPLQRLGVSKIDLIQFYWNDYSSDGYILTAQLLAEKQAQGKVVDVGLTNFDTERMANMVDGGVTIAANQVQYSLLDRRPELLMTDFCKENGVAILPYGVVAGGFLSEKYMGLKPTDVTLETSSMYKYSSVIRKAGGWEWYQELLKACDVVARKHQVSIADVATRWVLEKEVVPAVIIGARNATHIADHKRINTFRLDSDDYALINDILDQGTLPRADCYEWERGGVF